MVNMLPLNSARLGVGYCGLLLRSQYGCASSVAVHSGSYLLSMFMFCERSAARLAVGEEPRTGGGILK